MFESTAICKLSAFIMVIVTGLFISIPVFTLADPEGVPLAVFEMVRGTE